MALSWRQMSIELSSKQFDFINEIKQKQYAALKVVNVELIRLYWGIGNPVAPALSAELQQKFFPGRKKTISEKLNKFFQQLNAQTK